MKIKGLTACEFYLDNWNPKILLFTRDENKFKKIEEHSNYLPYIYVNEENLKKVQMYFCKDIQSIEKTSKEFILDKNEKLWKVILNNPFTIYKIKELIKCHEADISYSNKWIIDNVEELSAVPYRINYLDIETTSDKGFPNFMDPVENIISLACYDNFNDKSYLWIWHLKYKEEKFDKQVEEGKLEICRFTNEKDMLNDYLDFMVRTQPDFVTSWHVSFDINYLCARLERLKLNWNKMSPLYGTKYESKVRDIIKWREGGGVYGKRFGVSDRDKHIEIKGLHYFDLLTAYKNIVAKEQQSWKLDFIAQKELGTSKLNTHFDIGTKWLINPEFIEEYNYIDVFLIKKLDEKMKIIDRYTSIKDKSFLHNINDVFSTGRVLDNYILKKYKDKFIFPSKVFDMSLDKRIAGGFVRDNKAGIYNNIAVFDFSGFYPSLMSTFNLSSEKLIKENVIIFDPLISETESIASIADEKMYEWNEKTKEIIYKIRTEKFAADLTYKLDNPGVLTQAVVDLIKLRTSAKKEMKKYKYGTIDYKQAFDAQFSYKFLINGIYGSCAYPGFRLFKLHNANAITAFARMLSKWVQHRLKEKGWITIAGDTDSLFIQLKDNALELNSNLKEINEQIMPIIKSSIKEFTKKFLPESYANNHVLKMDMEKLFKNLLLMDAKKKYVGYLKYHDGEIINDLYYMGLDLKKSNTIEISKKGQMDLILDILNKRNIELGLRNYYDKLLEEKDINMFKIPAKLEKSVDEYKVNTPTKRAVKWSNKNLKTKFRQGTKFYILYVKSSKDIDTDVIAFENIDQLKHLNLIIDKTKYLKDIYNKFDNVINGIKEFKEINDVLYEQYKPKKLSLKILRQKKENKTLF